MTEMVTNFLQRRNYGVSKDTFGGNHSFLNCFLDSIEGFNGNDSESKANEVERDGS